MNEDILENRQEFVVKNNLVFKVMRDTQLYLYVPTAVDKQLLQYMLFILDKKRLVREITSHCLYYAFLRPKMVPQTSEKAKPVLIPSQSFAVDLLVMVSYKNDNV